jgi:hypothetical protein
MMYPRRTETMIPAGLSVTAANAALQVFWPHAADHGQPQCALDSPTCSSLERPAIGIALGTGLTMGYVRNLVPREATIT